MIDAIVHYGQTWLASKGHSMNDRTKEPMRPKDDTRRKSTRKVRAVQSRKEAVKAFVAKYEVKKK